MKDLKRLLKPLKKKLIINNLIGIMSRSLAVSLSAVFVILVFSKFVFVPFKALLCISIVVLGLAVGIILSFTKYKVTDYNTAKEGDCLGCEERLITAYGILMSPKEKTPMEELVVKDAIMSAKREEPHKKYKIGIPKKMLIVSALLVMASLLTGFAPDAGIYIPTFITEQALKETETIEKSVNKDEALSQEFKEEYNKILKELKKDLKKAKDSKEARKLLNDAQKELKKLENKALEDKNRIKNILSDFSSGSDISTAMDLNDMTALSKALEKLSLELEDLSEEELEKLKELLKETMENLSDEELEKLLEEALKALEEGDIAELAEALKNAASSSMSKASAVSSAVRRTASSIAKASDGTGKTATSTPVSGGDGNGEGSGKGNGEGNGSGNGNGSGSGEGSGSGNGNGNGSGSGSGTGNGAGTGGTGRGFGHTEPEKVFSRAAEGLLGEEEQLQSQQTEDGEVTYSETKAGGVNGESVPYDTVVKQYMEHAIKETEDGDIPYGMKEVIAEYFAGLEK